MQIFAIEPPNTPTQKVCIFYWFINYITQLHNATLDDVE